MLEDNLGFSFNVGCTVAPGNTVTRIENEKIYLDNGKIPIRYPERLLIIEQDILYRMVKNHEKSE